MDQTNRWPDLGNPRTGMRIVAALLLLYALTFLAFYPDVITIRDEGSYIRQARLMLEGTSALRRINPFTGVVFEAETLSYPVGTALFMTPFIWLWGWRGAFLTSLLFVAAGTWITARWLRDEGRAPAFALVVLGFPATLLAGRIAMSDAPSLAIAALGLWLFWKGLDGPRVQSWLAAGLVAGASMIWREGNVLVFVPLFVGAAIRRDRGVGALVAGGLIGVGLRLLSSQIAYGDPLHYKSPGEEFALTHVLSNLPLHAAALLFFVPLGIVGAAAYRGRRRPEMVATTALFLAFHLLYSYSGSQSGTLKQLLLGTRFFLPLLPLLAFSMAESLPRLWQQHLSTLTEARAVSGRRVVAVTIAAWVMGIGIAAVAVHPVHAHWGRGQAAIRDVIAEHLGEKTVVVTNWRGTSKYLDLLRGRHLPLNREAISARHIAVLLTRYPEILIVFLDRSDSALWVSHSAGNDAFIETLPRTPQLVLDRQVTASERIRIWRLAGVGPAS